MEVDFAKQKTEGEKRAEKRRSLPQSAALTAPSSEGALLNESRRDSFNDNGVINSALAVQTNFMQKN